MAWWRDRFHAAAERAFNVRLLVADGGAVQARGDLPDVEGCEGGGTLVSETDGRQKRTAPCVAAGTLKIGLAAAADSVAQARGNLAGIQDCSFRAKASGSVGDGPLRVSMPSTAQSDGTL